LQQLLDSRRDDLSITSRIERPQNRCEGLDLKRRRRVTFEAERCFVEVMASWKFDPSVSDRNLADETVMTDPQGVDRAKSKDGF